MSTLSRWRRLEGLTYTPHAIRPPQRHQNGDDTVSGTPGAVNLNLWFPEPGSKMARSVYPALPLPSVMTAVPEKVPEPLSRLAVTDTPATPFPKASVTWIDGWGDNCPPMTGGGGPGCWVMTMCAAGPTRPDAVNVTGLPTRLPEVAVTELLFVPAVVPRVQLVRVATPLPSVMTVAGPAGEIEPPPLATAKTTDTPAFGLPFASVTRTDGGSPTLVPAVPV